VLKLTNAVPAFAERSIMATRNLNWSAVMVAENYSDLQHNPGLHACEASRDAIVLSAWGWETFNVPERIALALSFLGMKVLYCENPASRFRRRNEGLREVEKGIYRLQPTILGHRLNRLPFMPAMQSKVLARQILQHAEELQLKKPIIFFPYYGELLPVCAELKKAGLSLVFVCADFPVDEHSEHLRISDQILVIPRSGYHRLRAEFGGKVSLIPQSIRMPAANSALSRLETEIPELAQIPHPRLGYLGVAHTRVNLPILEELLKNHPEWHFVSFGDRRCVQLPNAHVIGWRNERELPRLIAGLDVGFMPYKCTDDMNFNCVPLKLFDYFAAAVPVVATPIVNLWEYHDLIYMGDTAQELVAAVECALREPVASPKKKRRREIAAQHSIERLSDCLSSIFGIVAARAEVRAER
jgi:glycosyltransferase involved in cell wall biosynthesis